MLNDINSMIGDHLGVSESAQIKTASVEMNFVRNNVTNLANSLTIQGGSIVLPSFCEMLSFNENCGSTIIRQQV